MTNQAIGAGVRTIGVNPEETTQVTVLWIEGDHEHIKPGSLMGDRGICCE
jgi:hypothetical protein